jgi:hypothetical protein
MIMMFSYCVFYYLLFTLPLYCLTYCLPTAYPHSLRTIGIQVFMPRNPSYIRFTVSDTNADADTVLIPMLMLLSLARQVSVAAVLPT